GKALSKAQPAEDLPTHHHKIDIAKIANILVWFPTDRNDICVLSFLYRAHGFTNAQRLCPGASTCTDCFERSKARIYQVLKFQIQHSLHIVGTHGNGDAA